MAVERLYGYERLLGVLLYAQHTHYTHTHTHTHTQGRGKGRKDGGGHTYYQPITSLVS